MKSNPRFTDEQWADLQLRASICPHQARWPTGDVHWRRLHEVAAEARGRVRRAYAAMDEIDSNADLSREDKERERRKIAGQAVADFEASRTLLRAREAVRLLLSLDDLSPEIAEAARKSMGETEKGWQRAIDMIVERAAQTKVPGGARRGALISGGW
jgi:hypothetical protein